MGGDGLKEKVVMVFGLFFFFLSPLVVQASSPNDQLVQKQMEQLDISEIRQYWEDIVTKYGGFLPESQKGSIAEFLSGEKQLSLKEWLIAFGKFLFYELQANGKLLGTLILLTVFSMVLQSLQNAFEQQAVSKVAYAVVYMVLLIIALNSFRVAMDYALDAVQTMSHFMIAMIPLLLAALLSIVSTLTDHYKVTQLAELLTKVGIGILGVILTIFLGVMSVKGATSAIADGIALRTAKFVTGNFIPVVGKMFTDAADTVVAASMLLKNTVGIVGVAVLFIIAAFPALKIFAIAFIYKVSAAVMQPLGGGPVISCLSIMSKSIAYVFASLAIVSLMFFLSLTIIITAGNITMMVR
jgi:stage III sporulation protein AE